MIGGGRGPSRRGLVAVVALGGWVTTLVGSARPSLSILAHIAAAMTGGALSGQPRVVHRADGERGGAGMTDVALAVVWDVSRALALGAGGTIVVG